MQQEDVLRWRGGNAACALRHQLLEGYELATNEGTEAPAKKAEQFIPLAKAASAALHAEGTLIAAVFAAATGSTSTAGSNSAAAAAATALEPASAASKAPAGEEAVESKSLGSFRIIQLPAVSKGWRQQQGQQQAQQDLLLSQPQQERPQEDVQQQVTSKTCESTLQERQQIKKKLFSNAREEEKGGQVEGEGSVWDTVCDAPDTHQLFPVRCTYTARGHAVPSPREGDASSNEAETAAGKGGHKNRGSSRGGPRQTILYSGLDRGTPEEGQPAKQQQQQPQQERRTRACTGADVGTPAAATTGEKEGEGRQTSREERKGRSEFSKRCNTSSCNSSGSRASNRGSNNGNSVTGSSSRRKDIGPSCNRMKVSRDPDRNKINRALLLLSASRRETPCSSSKHQPLRQQQQHTKHRRHLVIPMRENRLSCCRTGSSGFMPSTSRSIRTCLTSCSSRKRHGRSRRSSNAGGRVLLRKEEPSGTFAPSGSCVKQQVSLPSFWCCCGSEQSRAGASLSSCSQCLHRELKRGTNGSSGSSVTRFRMLATCDELPRPCEGPSHRRKCRNLLLAPCRPATVSRERRREKHTLFGVHTFGKSREKQKELFVPNTSEAALCRNAVSSVCTPDASLHSDTSGVHSSCASQKTHYGLSGAHTSRGTLAKKTNTVMLACDAPKHLSAKGVGTRRGCCCCSSTQPRRLLGVDVRRSSRKKDVRSRSSRSGSSSSRGGNNGGGSRSSSRSSSSGNVHIPWAGITSKAGYRNAGCCTVCLSSRGAAGDYDQPGEQRQHRQQQGRTDRPCSCNAAAAASREVEAGSGTDRTEPVNQSHPTTRALETPSAAEFSAAANSKLLVRKPVAGTETEAAAAIPHEAQTSEPCVGAGANRRVVDATEPTRRAGCTVATADEEEEQPPEEGTATAHAGKHSHPLLLLQATEKKQEGQEVGNSPQPRWLSTPSTVQSVSAVRSGSWWSVNKHTQMSLQLSRIPRILSPVPSSRSSQRDDSDILNSCCSGDSPGTGNTGCSTSFQGDHKGGLCSSNTSSGAYSNSKCLSGSGCNGTPVSSSRSSGRRSGGNSPSSLSLFKYPLRVPSFFGASAPFSGSSAGPLQAQVQHQETQTQKQDKRRQTEQHQQANQQQLAQQLQRRSLSQLVAPYESLHTQQVVSRTHQELQQEQQQKQPQDEQHGDDDQQTKQEQEQRSIQGQQRAKQQQYDQRTAVLMTSTADTLSLEVRSADVPSSAGVAAQTSLCAAVETTLRSRCAFEEHALCRVLRAAGKGASRAASREPPAAAISETAEAGSLAAPASSAGTASATAPLAAAEAAAPAAKAAAPPAAAGAPIWEGGAAVPLQLGLQCSRHLVTDVADPSRRLCADEAAVAAPAGEAERATPPGVGNTEALQTNGQSRRQCCDIRLSVLQQGDNKEEGSCCDIPKGGASSSSLKLPTARIVFDPSLQETSSCNTWDSRSSCGSCSSGSSCGYIRQHLIQRRKHELKRQNHQQPGEEHPLTSSVAVSQQEGAEATSAGRENTAEKQHQLCQLQQQQRLPQDEQDQQKEQHQENAHVDTPDYAVMKSLKGEDALVGSRRAESSCSVPFSGDPQSHVDLDNSSTEKAVERPLLSAAVDGQKQQQQDYQAVRCCSRVSCSALGLDAGGRTKLFVPAEQVASAPKLEGAKTPASAESWEEKTFPARGRCPCILTPVGSAWVPSSSVSVTAAIHSFAAEKTSLTTDRAVLLGPEKPAALVKQASSPAPCGAVMGAAPVSTAAVGDVAGSASGASEAAAAACVAKHALKDPSTPRWASAAPRKQQLLTEMPEKMKLCGDAELAYGDEAQQQEMQKAPGATGEVQIVASAGAGAALPARRTRNSKADFVAPTQTHAASVTEEEGETAFRAETLIAAVQPDSCCCWARGLVSICSAAKTDAVQRKNVCDRAPAEQNAVKTFSCAGAPPLLQQQHCNLVAGPLLPRGAVSGSLLLPTCKAESAGSAAAARQQEQHTDSDCREEAAVAGAAAAPRLPHHTQQTPSETAVLANAGVGGVPAPSAPADVVGKAADARTHGLPSSSQQAAVDVAHWANAAERAPLAAAAGGTNADTARKGNGAASAEEVGATPATSAECGMAVAAAREETGSIYAVQPHTHGGELARRAAMRAATIGACTFSVAAQQPKSLLPCCKLPASNRLTSTFTGGSSPGNNGIVDVSSTSGSVGVDLSQSSSSVVGVSEIIRRDALEELSASSTSSSAVKVLTYSSGSDNNGPCSTFSSTGTLNSSCATVISSHSSSANLLLSTSSGNASLSSSSSSSVTPGVPVCCREPHTRASAGGALCKQPQQPTLQGEQHPRESRTEQKENTLRRDKPQQQRPRTLSGGRQQQQWEQGLVDARHLLPLRVQTTWGLVEVSAAGEFSFSFRARSELKRLYERRTALCCPGDPLQQQSHGSSCVKSNGCMNTRGCTCGSNNGASTCSACKNCGSRITWVERCSSDIRNTPSKSPGRAAAAPAAAAARCLSLLSSDRTLQRRAMPVGIEGDAPATTSGTSIAADADAGSRVAPTSDRSEPPAHDGSTAAGGGAACLAAATAVGERAAGDAALAHRVGYDASSSEKKSAGVGERADFGATVAAGRPHDIVARWTGAENKTQRTEREAAAPPKPGDAASKSTRDLLFVVLLGGKTVEIRENAAGKRLLKRYTLPSLPERQRIRYQHALEISWCLQRNTPRVIFDLMTVGRFQLVGCGNTLSVLRGCFESSFSPHVASAQLEGGSATLKICTRSGTALELPLSVLEQLTQPPLVVFKHSRPPFWLGTCPRPSINEEKLLQRLHDQPQEQPLHEEQFQENPRCLSQQQSPHRAPPSKQSPPSVAHTVKQFQSSGSDRTAVKTRPRRNKSCTTEERAHQARIVELQQSTGRDAVENLPAVLKALAEAQLSLAAVAQICPVMLEAYSLCCAAEERGLRRFHAKVQRRLKRACYRGREAAARAPDRLNSRSYMSTMDSSTDSSSALSCISVSGLPEICDSEYDIKCDNIGVCSVQVSPGVQEAASTRGAAGGSVHMKNFAALPNADVGWGVTKGSRDDESFITLQRKVYLSVFPLWFKQH